MIHDTQSAQTSQKQDGHNIYVIMRTMRSPGYHHVHTSCFQVHELPQSYCADNWYIVYFFLPLESQLPRHRSRRGIHRENRNYRGRR